MGDPADAARLAELFGLGNHASLIGPVAAGHVGEVWQLATDQGRFAVKRARAAPSIPDAETDAAYQAEVHGAGVNMPAVIRTVDGALIADIGGSWIRVYEWVDVLPAERGLDPEQLGRLLAAIHAVIVPTHDEVDGWYVDPVGAATWWDLLARLRIAKAPFAGRLAAQIPALIEAEDICTSPRQVQLCHRDLWSDNIRRTPSRELLVLDWENSGPADPNGELGCALFEYGLGQAHRIRRIHKAYCHAGGPGRITNRSDLTMLVAQLSHIAELGCQRWLTSTNDDERASNANRITEYLNEPVTLATLDHILLAVTDR